MTVFDVFTETPFKFIELNRGTVFGNEVKATKCLSGVFKMKQGQSTSNNIETPTSTATLHVHPEDFKCPNHIVGNAIAVLGATYDIISMTAGTNFENGIVEHYTLTLQRTDLAEVES